MFNLPVGTLKKLFSPAKRKADRLVLAEFDTDWFKTKYVITDCSDRNGLYRKYKRMLRTSPVSPNGKFNEAAYRLNNPDVAEAVKAGRIFSGFEHYVLVGRDEGRVCGLENRPNQPDIVNLARLSFDPDWYLRTYPQALQEAGQSGEEAFNYYLNKGVHQKHSPNAWFDEVWYRAFYSDVEAGIESGQVNSGFQHFLLYGKSEGRIPHRKTEDILNFKFPGLTALTGLERVVQLEGKLKPLPVEAVAASGLRINFVLPTVDRDIMFGGYAAILQLLRRVVEMGYDTRILVTEDGFISREYAQYNLASVLGGNVDKVDFLNITHRNKTVQVGADDRFIAYSAWTALIASDLASCTSEKKFIFLAQEDERIFHHNDSIRALIEQAYSLPHVALFNSEELKRHFEKNRLGVFGTENPADQNHFFFSHVLTPVQAPVPQDFAGRAGKRLLFYARPESHAARNIFEIGFLGLKEAVRRGHFDRTWSFDGVGTLVAKRSVDIGNGMVLNLMPKLDGGSYGKLLGGYDVGLSLMYAPHPGLVHFEMAAAGMVVVANEYEYRDEQYFKNKSDNFVVTKPTISGIAEALGKAAKQASDIPTRLANAYKPQGAANWDQVFTDEFVSRLLGTVCRG